MKLPSVRNVYVNFKASGQCQRQNNVNVPLTWRSRRPYFYPHFVSACEERKKYFHFYIVSGCEQKWEDLVRDVKVNATITTDTRSKQLSVQLHNSPSLTHSRYTWKFLYFQRSPSPNFTISTHNALNWWESSSRGLVNWAQNCLTRSLPACASSKLCEFFNQYLIFLTQNDRVS